MEATLSTTYIKPTNSISHTELQTYLISLKFVKKLDVMLWYVEKKNSESNKKTKYPHDWIGIRIPFLFFKISSHWSLVHQNISNRISLASTLQSCIGGLQNQN